MSLTFGFSVRDAGPKYRLSTAHRLLGAQSSTRGEWNADFWGTLGVVATIRYRTLLLIAFSYRETSSLRKVSLTAHRRVWGRTTTYLYSTLHSRHPAMAKTKESGAKLLINETSKPSPQITWIQMIDISPRNQINKRNQFSRRYAAPPKLLNHPRGLFNPKNTNNVRKWDDKRVKSGRHKFPEREVLSH